ncbi:glycosyl-transferase for dystroglycan domain-containing protein [Ditylenchus destructor]|uniref:Glycosyl-transferase for dystroglycan domain-containing protein n=1 Tax=Ditylenchus destructor TaxID=166010 RepID=A0AAD4NBQ0_9BILA|nr:glycosyl-transferase for dystroglycan domain-containing protein [Ditylenchus destructor]
MRKIVDQALSWEDFISYAVLIRSGEELNLPTLFKVWFCNESVRQKVSIHLVWMRAPFQNECTWDYKATLFETSQCDAFNNEEILLESNLPMFMADLPEIMYPINFLRNIARNGASTQLHIVADIENIFSDNFCYLVRNATRMLVEDDMKIAFIYRRFEVESDVEQVPTKLSQLFTLHSENMAFYFHQKFFAPGHFIRNLSGWFNYSMGNPEVITMPFDYTSKRITFEPQFIMRATAPEHFEGAPTRFYDHQVLINELCRAGYTFRVLSHVFNIHIGVKRKLTEAEILTSRIAKSRRWPFRDRFYEYLDEKYGPRKNCPKL